MYQEAQQAFKALHENRPIASLIECSAKQVLIVADWHDDDTGLTVPFASLLDLVPHVSSPTWGKHLVDIKTARNGNPANWSRVVDDSGYDVQAALYMDIHHAATVAKTLGRISRILFRRTSFLSIAWVKPTACFDG